MADADVAVARGLCCGSSSSSNSLRKNDVFISFRGDDTRNNFTSHLHAALCRAKIKTYIDYALEKGDQISEALAKAIGDSYVAVVVFSENYASSTWCLDELTHIMNCKKQDQIVVPVFYNVDPSHVRKQKGSYWAAFEKQVRNLKYMKKVKGWREALTEAASLAGWDSRIYMLESELVDDIVQDVLRKLQCKYPTPSESEGLVGIDKHCAHIESFLRIGSGGEVRMIGIWGMGGIGKTTIAAAMFDHCSSHFEGSCFLENVGDESDRHGLTYLRNKLVSMLLEEENPHIGTVRSGSNFSKSRLSHKKVFIVLDDLRTPEQLDYIVGGLTCLGAGSRVIVTTRDKHLLSRAHEIYEVNPLNFHESLQLFSLSAFNKVHPDIGYEPLSESVVIYADGIPLALKVLGSLFRSKSKEMWLSTMTKLKKIPCKEVQNILRLSYDGLDDTEKEIFLDIACFLNGQDRQLVMRLLDACGFFAGAGLETLLEKALITVSNNNEIRMHALIQEMGWEIVRQESTKDPGRRSRLYDHDEVYDVLKYNMGTSAVEGISIDVSRIRSMNLSSDIFAKMINLRFLRFYSRWGDGCNVSLPAGLESLPNKLRFLHWNGYPLKSLPSAFSPEKLVEISMPNSHVQRLWDGVQDLTNLQKMDLSCSEHLIELPDLSMASNLESINLSRCASLCHVHPSILSLKRLVNLNLVWCKKLKTLLSNDPLRSLRILELYGCSSLEEFSVTSKEMTYLDLRSTAINVLPSSMKHLGNLMNLELSCCGSLRNLPNELSCLKSLGRLVLSDCRQLDTSNLHLLFDGIRSLGYLCLDNCCNLTELPNNISLLSSLYYLSLSGSNVENIPENIKHLSQLESLDLCKCRRIQYLPELPPSIEVLDVTNCTSLETVCTSRVIDELLQEHKVFISFKNCVKLSEHSRNVIMEDAHVRIKEVAYVHVSARIERSEPSYFFKSEVMPSYHHPPTVIFPGSRVPDWFHYRSTKPFITIELSHSSQSSNICGFIFCLVLPPSPSNEINCNWKIRCECYLEGGGEKIRNTSMCSFATGLVSDHVYLWYDENFCLDVFNTITESTRTNYDQYTTAFNPKLSFQFFVETEDELNLVIKECGICQIYGSEYLNFVEQLGYELELGNKLKRCREDIYELEESSETGTQDEGCFEHEDEQQVTFHQTKKYKVLYS